MQIIDKVSIEKLTQLTKESNSFNELILKLGYSTLNGGNCNTVRNKLIKYNIDYSHFRLHTHVIKRTVDNVFIKNSTATLKVLRHWYIKGEYSDYKCSICGMQPIWLGKSLVLILDHINGCSNDDRLENLRWVCPNCNMLLPTTNGRNKSRKR